jgi:hypothetical protein
MENVRGQLILVDPAALAALLVAAIAKLAEALIHVAILPLAGRLSLLRFHAGLIALDVLTSLGGIALPKDPCRNSRQDERRQERCLV